MHKKNKNNNLIAENRQAKYHYTIEETFEAGIVLQGSEVKSIRMHGGISLIEAHAGIGHDKEFFLFNANIPEYKMAHNFNHEAKRPRKLLLKRREINKIIGQIQKQGCTSIPLKMYFNNRGNVKILIGLAKGKKITDKRKTIKDRDWQREKEAIFKHNLKT